MWIVDIFRKKRDVAGHPVAEIDGHPVAEIDEPPVAEIDEHSSPRTTRVSREKVDEIVEGFMQNNSVNSALLPDFIERAIYTNVVTLVLGIAEEVLEGTSIEILGHRVELSIRSR
jgi:hypothetical protein